MPMREASSDLPPHGESGVIMYVVGKLEKWMMKGEENVRLKSSTIEDSPAKNELFQDTPVKINEHFSRRILLSVHEMTKNLPKEKRT